MKIDLGIAEMNPQYDMLYNMSKMILYESWVKDKNEVAWIWVFFFGAKPYFGAKAENILKAC